MRSTLFISLETYQWSTKYDLIMDFINRWVHPKKIYAEMINNILFHSTWFIKICLHLCCMLYTLQFNPQIFRFDAHIQKVFFNSMQVFHIQFIHIWCENQTPNMTIYNNASNWIFCWEVYFFLNKYLCILNNFTKTTHFELKRTKAFSSRLKNTLIS